MVVVIEVYNIQCKNQTSSRPLLVHNCQALDEDQAWNMHAIEGQKNGNDAQWSKRNCIIQKESRLEY